jgi:TetR/AcrR family transcriptional regulator, transcriptional repressor of bet genes
MTKNENVRHKRTASPEERKRQLIEATITSISRNGITGTTLTAVTGIAELSLGLVNFHFKTKDALLVATLTQLATELRDRWLETARRTDLEPHKKLATIVEAHFDGGISNRRKLAVWFAFFGETKQRKSYRECTAALDMERLDISIELSRALIAQGGYDHVNPDGVGEALEALFDGFWLNILMYPARFSNDGAKAHIYAYLAGQFPRHFTDAGTT